MKSKSCRSANGFQSRSFMDGGNNFDLRTGRLAFHNLLAVFKRSTPDKIAQLSQFSFELAMALSGLRPGGSIT